MMVSRSTTIDAPPERICDSLLTPWEWLGGQRIALEQTASGFALSTRVPWLGRRKLEIETERSPEGRVVWRSAPEAWLRFEASAQFTPAPRHRGTELHARVEATPSPGLGAGWVRHWIGGIAERVLGVALARLKQFVETGETPTANPRVRPRTAYPSASSELP
jgi:hypothetical protein